MMIDKRRRSVRVTGQPHQVADSRRRQAFLLLVAATLFAGIAVGCKTSPLPIAVVPSTAQSTNEGALVSEQSVLGVLWFQRAAECRALYYQACNIARERIDQYLQARRQSANPDPRPLAIIVDIDETVLDNSAYNARLIRTGAVYDSTTWQAWVTAEQAATLPGISNLFRHASSNGVEIFYVSNRKTNDNGLAHTINNLRSQGLPYADTNHVLLRSNAQSESKDDRRGPLTTNGVYDVVLLMGDNLADFHHDFESPPAQQTNRLARTDRAAARFGVTYILLPNPMYGNWENALYPVTAANKAVLRREWLRAFEAEEETR